MFPLTAEDVESPLVVGIAEYNPECFHDLSSGLHAHVGLKESVALETLKFLERLKREDVETAARRDDQYGLLDLEKVNFFAEAQSG